MLLVIYSPKILSPNSEKYLESYNSDPPVVIRFLTYFHLLGSRIQVIIINCTHRILDDGWMPAGGFVRQDLISERKAEWRINKENIFLTIIRCF